MPAFLRRGRPIHDSTDKVRPIAAKEKQIQNVLKDLDALRKSNADALKDADALRNKIKDLEKAVQTFPEDKKKAVETLEGQLKQKAGDAETATKQAIGVRKDLEKAKAEYARSDERVKALEASSKALSDQIEQSKKDLAQSLAERDALEKVFDAKCEKIKMEIVELGMSQVSDYEKMMSAVKHQEESWRKDIADARQKLATFQDAHTKLQQTSCEQKPASDKQIPDAGDQNASLQCALDTNKAIHKVVTTDLKTQIADWGEKHDALQTSCDKLTAENEATNKALVATQDQTQKTIANSSAALMKLDSDLVQSQAAKKKSDADHAAEIGSTKKQLTDSEDARKKAELDHITETQSLKKDIADAREAKTKLDTDYKALVATLGSDLQVARDDRAQDAAAFTAALNKARAEADEQWRKLADERDEWAKKYDVETKQLADVMQQNDDLKAAPGKLKSEVELLRADFADLKITSEATEARMKSAEHDRDENSKKADNLEAELKALKEG